MKARKKKWWWCLVQISGWTTVLALVTGQIECCQTNLKSGHGSWWSLKHWGNPYTPRRVPIVGKLDAWVFKRPQTSLPSLGVPADENGGGKSPSWQNLCYQIGQLKNSIYCQGNDSTHRCQWGLLTSSCIWLCLTSRAFWGGGGWRMLETLSCQEPHTCNAQGQFPKEIGALWTRINSILQCQVAFAPARVFSISYFCVESFD